MPLPGDQPMNEPGESSSRGVKRELDRLEGEEEDTEMSVEGVFDLVEQWVCEIKAAFEAREEDWDPIWDAFGEDFGDLGTQNGAPGAELVPPVELCFNRGKQNQLGSPK